MKKALNLAIAPKMFSEFWDAYPKREGANPKDPAYKSFQAALASGDDPEAIISGAHRYADELRRIKKFGTSYVAAAMTWLNEQRWNDYAPPPYAAEQDAERVRNMARRGYEWRDNKWQKLVKPAVGETEQGGDTKQAEED
jgi:hypothetical protein